MSVRERIFQEVLQGRTLMYRQKQLCSSGPSTELAEQLLTKERKGYGYTATAGIVVLLALAFLYAGLLIVFPQNRIVVASAVFWPVYAARYALLLAEYSRKINRLETLCLMMRVFDDSEAAGCGLPNEGESECYSQ